MLKTKVKISKVNNLTDARYFAAMGVDYLGFCCNTGTEMFCTPGRIKEITEWIEGPEFVLEFDGYQNENDIKSILELNLGSALHFGTFATYENDFPVPIFQDFIMENIHEKNIMKYDYPVIRSDKKFSLWSNEEIHVLSKNLSIKNCYLDINFEPNEVHEILERLPVFGLILRGGEEERIGVKSFDQLDIIFDKLVC